MDSNETGEDNMKSNFKGGSALALENTMTEYLKNRSMFSKMKKAGRKVKLFEESNLLSDENIIEGLD